MKLNSEIEWPQYEVFGCLLFIRYSIQVLRRLESLSFEAQWNIKLLNCFYLYFSRALVISTNDTSYRTNSVHLAGAIVFSLWSHSAQAIVLNSFQPIFCIINWGVTMKPIDQFGCLNLMQLFPVLKLMPTDSNRMDQCIPGSVFIEKLDSQHLCGDLYHRSLHTCPL